MTQAIWAMPFELICAWLKKMRPKWSRSGRPRPGAEGSRRRCRPDRRTAGGSPRRSPAREVLLDRQRIVGAALHRRVVADDHHLPAPETRPMPAIIPAPGPRRRTCRRRRAGRSRGRRAGIEQSLDAVAGKQLAALDVTLAAFSCPPFAAWRHPRAISRRARGCVRCARNSSLSVAILLSIRGALMPSVIRWSKSRAARLAAVRCKAVA